MKMTRTLTVATLSLALLALPTTGGTQTPPVAPVGGGAVAIGADGGEYTPAGFALRGWPSRSND